MSTAVAQMRQLTGEELDLVSGGKFHVSSVGGLVFTHDDQTGETTVGATGITLRFTPTVRVTTVIRP